MSLVETKGIEEQDRHALLQLLSQVKPAITADPCQWTEANEKLLACMTFLLLARVESLYGASSHQKLNFHPSFMGHPHSMVCPLKGDHDTFGVTVGAHATTWEAVFYELGCSRFPCTDWG